MSAMLAGAEPFAADGGPVGVVLSHGFTGTPASMRPWADHLAAAGFTVRLPLLAGLVLVNPAYRTDRFDAKLAPYISWAVRSRPSIGGDIKKPGVVESAFERTPVVAFASVQKLWKATVADLDQVRAPILLYRSVEDHVVDPSSARLLKARAVNTVVREVLLHDSYHVATLDHDAERIFTGSVDFFTELSESSPVSTDERA